MKLIPASDHQQRRGQIRCFFHLRGRSQSKHLQRIPKKGLHS